MSSALSKEKAKIFETVLMSPGMAEKCKISVALSRQNVLLLARLIESGLLSNNGLIDDEIIKVFPKESIDEMRQVHSEILKKSELTDFYEKLKTI